MKWLITQMVQFAAATVTLMAPVARGGSVTGAELERVGDVRTRPTLGDARCSLVWEDVDPAVTLPALLADINQEGAVVVGQFG